MRHLRLAILVLFAAILAFGTRVANVRSVFLEGRIYFVDADCYSRMTRAQMVLEGRGPVIRHHQFENHPQGVTPHTTAPLDWLIAGLKPVLDLGFRLLDPQQTSVLRTQTLDLAGALVSPLLGTVTCVFLAFWAVRRERARRRMNAEAGVTQPVPHVALAVPLLFALSPILVHGTSLGRPDHQSLLIAVLALALGAESRLAGEITRRWAITSGVAWAVALWVSFYEPLVLFLAVLLVWATCSPRALITRERLLGFGIFAAISGATIALEGWRIYPPESGMLTYLANWNATIGELRHASPAIIFRWLGYACVLAPVLLVIRHRIDRRAVPMLVLLLLVLALAVWQVRWGYFLALVFVMTLPWQLAALRKTWLAWLVMFVGLWPILREWDERVFATDEAQRQLALRQREVVQLREYAERMRAPEQRAFIAPWWMSPAIAYWSGQPGIAGSSHESLPGTVATARFYLSENPADAAAILRERQVGWVLADDPSRVISTSQALLGTNPPARPLATVLAERPREAPPFLIEHSGPPPEYGDEPQFYRLFRVETANLSE